MCDSFDCYQLLIVVFSHHYQLIEIQKMNKISLLKKYTKDRKTDGLTRNQFSYIGVNYETLGRIEFCHQKIFCAIKCFIAF